MLPFAKKILARSIQSPTTWGSMEPMHVNHGNFSFADLGISIMIDVLLYSSSRFVWIGNVHTPAGVWRYTHTPSAPSCPRSFPWERHSSPTPSHPASSSHHLRSSQPSHSAIQNIPKLPSWFFTRLSFPYRTGNIESSQRCRLEVALTQACWVLWQSSYLQQYPRAVSNTGLTH